MAFGHVILTSSLYEARRGTTKWDEIKSKGISVLSGTRQVTAKELMESCKRFGLFIVYKGELESWMNLPVGKKNKGEWVVKAVETLDEGCPKDLTDFLEEIFAYLQE